MTKRMTEFGGRIAAARQSSGLTQQQLADRLGVTQTAVSYWEAGKREPDVKTWCAFASLFDVTLDWLIGGLPEPTADHLEEARRLMVRIADDAQRLTTLYGSLYHEREGDALEGKRA